MRFVFLLLLILLSACNKGQESSVATTSSTPTDSASAASADIPPPPPTAPLRETFDGEPQLSLFPRTGAFRPEQEQAEAMGYWASFIDHIMRTSGVVQKAGKDGSNSWTIRGIKGLDSIAFFSPLGVKPATTYRVSFDFKGELPKGASGGVGVLEFDQFLWIADQFTEKLIREHQTAAHPGKSLTGNQEWKTHTFTFTTAPNTGMIHLVLFRDGVMDREKPVWFDNLAIEEVGAAATKN